MKARLLLAGTAVLAALSSAHAEVSVMGGAAIVTLPPLPGLAYEFVTTSYGPGQPMSAAAFGVAPVYGFAMAFIGANRIGAFGSGFYTAGTSGFTTEPIGGAGGAFGFYSIHTGYGYAFADVDYAADPDPASVSTTARPGGLVTFEGVTFEVAAAPDGGTAILCVDAEDPCDEFTVVPGGGPLGYATMIGEGGVLIAAAGLFPEGAITLTETAGFRYFGGQGGMSVALDLGNAQATAQLGGLFRSLEQTHTTTLEVDFAVPVDGGTLAVEQTAFGEESLLARYFGAFFGVSVESNATSRLVARLDVGAAPLLAMTQYTGFQSSTLDIEGPGTNLNYTTDLPVVTLSDMQFALLVNLGGEVGFRFGGAAKITFGGFVEVLSAAPELLRNHYDVRPTLDDPLRGFVSDTGAGAYAYNVGPSGVPVAIGYQPMLAYGASVRLSIGLGGP